MAPRTTRWPTRTTMPTCSVRPGRTPRTKPTPTGPAPAAQADDRAGTVARPERLAVRRRAGRTAGPLQARRSARAARSGDGAPVRGGLDRSTGCGCCTRTDRLEIRSWVLAAVRGLNRLERVGETARAALNELAVVAPDWLQALAPPTWYERYSRRVENYRLPKADKERLELVATIGADGDQLLTAIDAAVEQPWLAQLPAIHVLREVWTAHASKRTGSSGDAPSKRGRQPLEANLISLRPGGALWQKARVSLGWVTKRISPRHVTPKHRT